MTATMKNILARIRSAADALDAKLAAGGGPEGIPAARAVLLLDDARHALETANEAIVSTPAKPGALPGM